MRPISVVTAGMTTAVVAVALLAYRVAVKNEARDLLATATEVAASDDPNAAFAAVQSRYGTRLKQVEGCPATECAYELAVSNEALALLRLAPHTELKLRFNTKHNRVTGSMVDYRTTLRSGAAPVVHVQTDYCPGCTYFYLHPWANSSPDRYSGIVQLGAKAPPEMRRLAMGLEPGCLTKFNGCRDIAELLPTVWARTEDGNTMCRVPTDAGRWTAGSLRVRW